MRRKATKPKPKQKQVEVEVKDEKVNTDVVQSETEVTQEPPGMKSAEEEKSNESGDETGADDKQGFEDPKPSMSESGNGSGQQQQQQHPSTSLEEREKKLAELRNRMLDSTRLNRLALLTESQKAKTNAREATRRSKQLRLAESLRLRQQASERGEEEGGEDVEERKKNWEWTVEENEEWEKKKRRKERNADFEFHDEEQQARKRYKKDLAFLKPDLESYNRQKQLAISLGPGSSSTSSSSSSSSNALTTFDPSGGAGAVKPSYEQQRAAEALYRDANTLLYADNKPSEEAIDRVVEKLNLEQDKRNKFSRKRINEDEGDITYINERNRVFNKKIARYYDKYTAEIRASFERGTAL